MAFPGPRRLPALWQTAVVGPFTLPPVEGRGVVKVNVTPSLKKDDKKKAGKDGSKPAIERIEPKKIEVEFRFNEEIWEQVEPIIAGLERRSGCSVSNFDRLREGDRQTGSVVISSASWIVGSRGSS